VEGDSGTTGSHSSPPEGVRAGAWQHAAVHRRAERVAGAVLPLTLLAAAAALIAPSEAVAERSDLLLAALVALTALGIDPRRLWALRARPAPVLALSVGPLVVLVPLAWALGRAFDGPVRDGVLALGVAPTEVAAVGLVALAGADAVLALAVVAGSLVASAALGPVLLAALGGGAAGGVDLGPLLGHFALVVLAPLAAWLAARGLWPRLARGEPEYAAGSSLAVAALVYAALSGTAAAGESDLGSAVLAGGAFLIASAAVAAVLLREARDPSPAFCLGMRDFAVAAALAAEAFGPRAAVVAGAYGVLMLIAGAALAARVRVRA
jgi:predicted Na+-dependent transporter